MSDSLPVCENLCQQLALVMRRIYERGLTTTSGGNLSARDDAGIVWVTPAQIDKASLTASDIVGVTLDGEVVSGTHRPTSELHFHLATYRAHRELRAMVHAHSVGLVAYSAAGTTPPISAIRYAKELCGNVTLAPYAPPGSVELGVAVAAAFGEAWSVVLEKHGVVVGGTSLQEAFGRFEALETAAQTCLHGLRLGELQSAPETVATPPSAPPSTRSEIQVEPAIRRELCQLLDRAYQHRLVTSVTGAFSARVGERHFVISPEQGDRATLVPEDLVLWDLHAACQESAPRLARAHAAVYERHSDICTVLTASPVHATAYAVTRVPLPIDLIPESLMVLQRVSLVDSGCIDAPQELAEKISMQAPVLLVANEGCLVAGRDPLDAYDRLEVLESSAAAVIAAIPLGGSQAMSSAMVAELRRASPTAYGAKR